MKSYFRKPLLLLLVLLLGTMIYGCNRQAGPSFPLDAAEIQAAIDQEGLDWFVEEEINKEHDLSSGGFGKVFRLSKDGKFLGIITSIEKEDLRLITLNLIGKPVSGSKGADEFDAEEKKENWDRVLQMMGQLYGKADNTEKAYANMMAHYEADRNSENSYLHYSEEFDRVYYNVFFTKNIVVEHSSDDGPAVEEVIEYENNAAISIGNEGGNAFFLAGIEKYK